MSMVCFGNLSLMPCSNCGGVIVSWTESSEPGDSVLRPIAFGSSAGSGRQGSYCSMPSYITFVVIHIC